MDARRGRRYSLIGAACASSSLVRSEPLFDLSQKLATAPKTALSEPTMISRGSLSMAVYLNFHRPCYYAVDKIDAKGKIRKTYPHDLIMTPWEKLQSVPNYESLLKPEHTPQTLERLARAMTDSEAAQHVRAARRALFQSFARKRA